VGAARVKAQELSWERSAGAVVVGAAISSSSSHVRSFGTARRATTDHWYWKMLEDSALPRRPPGAARGHVPATGPPAPSLRPVDGTVQLEQMRVMRNRLRDAHNTALRESMEADSARPPAGSGWTRTAGARRGGALAAPGRGGAASGADAKNNLVLPAASSPAWLGTDEQESSADMKQMRQYEQRVMDKVSPPASQLQGLLHLYRLKAVRSEMNRQSKNRKRDTLVAHVDIDTLLAELKPPAEAAADPNREWIESRLRSFAQDVKALKWLPKQKEDFLRFAHEFLYDNFKSTDVKPTV